MVLLVFICFMVLLAGTGLIAAWGSLGGSVKGARLEKARESENYRKGKFLYPVATDSSFGIRSGSPEGPSPSYPWWRRVRELD